MIEVIGMSVQDGIEIEKGGGDRIELVRELSEGGLTPDFSILEDLLNHVKIPVNVMIRPHSRSFRYEDGELKKMEDDIKGVRYIGGNGVVFGALDEIGEIDFSALERLLRAADGLEVTFHRAIDELSDPVKGITLLKKYHDINTVLTSGGKGELMGNLEVIHKMISVGGPTVMIGGGLNGENGGTVKKATAASWYHFGRAARENNEIQGNVDHMKVKALCALMK